MPLDALPTELLGVIFSSFTSFPDVVSLSLTNKRLYSISAAHLLRTGVNHQPFTTGYQRTVFHRYITYQPTIIPRGIIYCSGSFKRSHTLLQNGADVNTTDTLGLTPLLSALALGRHETLHLLLSAPDIDVHKSAPGRNTPPLHHAILASTVHPDIVRKLITRGADITHPFACCGLSALELVAFAPGGAGVHLALVEIMISAGCDVNMKNERYGFLPRDLFQEFASKKESLLLRLREEGAEESVEVQRHVQLFLARDRVRNCAYDLLEGLEGLAQSRLRRQAARGAAEQKSTEDTWASGNRFLHVRDRVTAAMRAIFCSRK